MQNSKSRWWLTIGLIAFFLTGLGSGIGSFDSIYKLYSSLGVIDWLAASVLYFFFGAAVGLGIDFWISKNNKTNFRWPLWFYITIAFAVISILAMLVFSLPKSSSDLIFNIIFPFYYAIFFPGFAYYLFFPSLLEKSFVFKIFLDLIYLAMFGVWLKLEVNNKIKNPENKSTLSKALLSIIFIILAIGMISRAVNLGN